LITIASRTFLVACYSDLRLFSYKFVT
jgi:hypothetical protein